MTDRVLEVAKEQLLKVKRGRLKKRYNKSNNKKYKGVQNKKLNFSRGIRCLPKETHFNMKHILIHQPRMILS